MKWVSNWISQKKRLFDHDAFGVSSNFSLFRGSNREVTPEQVAEQINRSLSEIEAGDYEEVIYEVSTSKRNSHE